MASARLEELTAAEVMSEVRKLQYFYGLKHEIRYGQTRVARDAVESVAEHVYGLHILAHYFLTYEDPEGKWDRAKIFSMITLHDIDEIETGDVISYYKNDSHRATGLEAQQAALVQSPQAVQGLFSSIITEFEAQESVEARFVKALDKFEPFVQLYNEAGKQLLQVMKTTKAQSVANKQEFVEQFASITLFFKTLHSVMVDEGYFYDPKKAT